MGYVQKFRGSANTSTWGSGSTRPLGTSFAHTTSTSMTRRRTSSPDIACQLYYALRDCHLMHGCDVMLDVDPRSFAWLDDLNRAILRRMLGVGSRSGIPQLYSELGIYPLKVRRLELALRYLKYLVGLPSTHLARKAAEEHPWL
ncbi:hypothetical protein C8F01DRAFT_1115175 [Mycena amicta]|nr:hypothetical protein C8F01DRAFT_1115175 [Mycena amicta]